MSPLITVFAAAESGGSTATLVVGLLTASGFGAIVAAVVAGVFSKRKLGAEATEIITKAAAGVVTNLEREIVRQRESFDREIAEIKADHQREMEDVRRVLQLHVAWDAIAIAKLGELDIHLPPAPPLLPPHLGSRGTMDG
jgi:hypothetical protein